MSLEKKQQIQYLLLRYLDRVATDKEEALLFSLLEQEEDNKEWEPLIEELIAAEPELSNYRREEWQPIIPTILKQKTSKVVDINASKPWFVSSRTIKRIAVAASIVLLLGLGIAALVGVFTNKPTKPTVIASEKDRFKNDVTPGGFKARLTLADGRIIILDSAASGELTKQGNTIVTNKDGQLIYDDSRLPTPDSRLIYNTLSTSKGESYATVLADGSKVWLNSASSIRYPVAFVGIERKVEITGEAYFEVARDTKKKFIVTSNGVSTEVLGTHFNVNSYADENAIKVTLLEGSVKVSASTPLSMTQGVTIKPGQQAVIPGSHTERSRSAEVQTNIDLEEIIAWKNNRFVFNNADIQTIMRQVERWYDVEIIYEDKINQLFAAEIPRTVNASDFFRILEATGWVHFRIEGKKVTVMK